MYNPHRGLGPAPGGGNARLNELLDGIRAEFESQARASSDYEHSSKWKILESRWSQLHVTGRLLTCSVAQQIQEMQMVREKVYSMEQTHLALKQK